VKPADTRIAPDSKVGLSKWDPDDDAIVGKDKSAARALKRIASATCPSPASTAGSMRTDIRIV